jgi:cytochrome c peroxidase
MRRPLTLTTALVAMGCQIDNGIFTTDLPEETPVSVDDDDMSVEADPQQVAALQDVIERANIRGISAPPEVSPARAELGRLLAFDKILSGNRDIACMTCHHPTLASADARSLPIGAGGSGLGTERTHPEGVRIPRSGPALFNLHELEVMFWDGRVEEDRQGLVTPAGDAIDAEMEDTLQLGALAAQAMFPVLSADEMRGSGDDNELSGLDDDAAVWAGLMARLGEIDEYVDLFEEAYPEEGFDEMTFAHAAEAIASFEVSAFASAGSPWDRFLSGDTAAMTDDQIEGALLFFGPARCVTCHSGAALTDEQFHNIGLPQIGPGLDGEGQDAGREEATGDGADRYAFRTPPLRNVALTAPYGHAGQFVELRDFIGHYSDPERSLAEYDAGQLEPLLQGQVSDSDEVLQRLAPQLRGIDLREDDIDRLVAFMDALTDPAASELGGLVPASVPSGLPVTD